MIMRHNDELFFIFSNELCSMQIQVVSLKQIIHLNWSWSVNVRLAMHLYNSFCNSDLNRTWFFVYHISYDCYCYYDFVHCFHTIPGSLNKRPMGHNSHLSNTLLGLSQLWQQTAHNWIKGSTMEQHVPVKHFPLT